MGTIEAIFEGGVFRPVTPVVLPDKSRVQLQIVNGDQPPAAGDMEAIYKILDRRHETGICDLAARHNEHQP
jgi:predicted DNA-binding antitoxin AbrB/MazE fold protein